MSGNPLAQIPVTIQTVPTSVDPLVSMQDVQTSVDPPTNESNLGATIRNGTKPNNKRHVIARKIDETPDELVRMLRENIVQATQEAAGGASIAELERTFSEQQLLFGQRLLALMFASACRAALVEDLLRRRLSDKDIRLRTDAEGYATVSTSYGVITFPTFAYRDLTTPGSSVTRHPAQSLLPYHRRCRSTPLCLEWEVRLGAQHPFRKAEEMLQFFTRGASTTEDTTIARHMLALGAMVDPEWLYQTPENVRKTLREKATQDKISGRPLLYVSCDAHALRRYVDDTWALQWKMVNGIRMWCEDAATGRIVHLGGEFTWGDCREVGKRIGDLVAAGVLPNDDAAWKELNAQIVFVSDACPWLFEHIVPLLVDAITILDPYHLIDWVAQLTRLAFGAGTAASRALHARLRRILFNKRPKNAPKKPARRRGHKKTRRTRNPHTHDRPWDKRGRPRTVSSDFTARALLDLLAEVEVEKAEHVEALESLVERIANNTTRIDYPAYLSRGIQIGSGAMESLHRNGSQQRLKLPGARWLEDTSKAVLQFRMLELSGRWREFWDRPDIAQHIALAFEERRSAIRSEESTETAA